MRDDLSNIIEGAQARSASGNYFEKNVDLGIDKSVRRVLTNFPIDAIIDVVGVTDTSHGGVAQLVERLNGIQEVRGSTPLISTKELI